MSDTTIILIGCGVLLITNLTAFLLMKKDKEAASKGKWRVKERTLFLAAGCFGALGGVLGMQLLRHKTQHWYFRLFFPVMLVLQATLLGAGVWLLLK